MDLLETTAACYQSAAKLATFVQVHVPTKEAYLKSLTENPTKRDRALLTKELEALRLFGEMMQKEVKLMGAPPIEKDINNGQSTGEENR
jgi:hypothetical protein